MNDGKDASGMVTLSELDVSVPLSSLSLMTQMISNIFLNYENTILIRERMVIA